jgi:Ca2+-binding RTX toxin-like protein
VGSDSLDGQDGNDVLIGDDSVLVETSFTVAVSQTANFERFVEGIDDAGDEFAHAVLDLQHVEHHLRDTVVREPYGKKWREYVEHHIDVVLFGNDTLAGGAGNDLIIGDAFVTRTPSIAIIPGGLPEKYSRDNAWQDLDWKDCSPSDWFDHHHDHHDDDHDHDHWHVRGLKVNADVISGGAGNDLIWGDSLALISTTVTRGAGVSSKDFAYSEDDAEDGVERFAVLTDSADYWLALQGGGHGRCDFTNADDISGGDGDDILFGQAGDDKLRGDGGDDWLIGGDGDDCLDGGTGKNKKSSGNENSSSLRSAVAARLITWQDTFKNFGLPYNPFGGLNLGKGPCNNGDFDFLTLDTRGSRRDD